MTLRKTGLFAAIAAALLTPMTAQAQSITNGTFDTVVPNNGTGGGWTAANNDGAGGHRTTGGNPGGFFILNDNGSAGSDPTLSQLVTGFSVGATYNISGNFRTQIIGQTTGAVQAFGVAINGVFVFESPGLPNDTVWRNFSANFVATSSSMTILLAGERNGTDNDFAVDNIALTTVAAANGPEPGSLLLVGVGLIGGIVLRRRIK